MNPRDLKIDQTSTLPLGSFRLHYNLHATVTSASRRSFHRKGVSIVRVYKGRVVCASKWMVKGLYNDGHPSRKSCSSSITNTAFSGTEPNTRKTDMTERLSKRVRQSYGTEMGWGVQTPVSNVGTSRKQTIEQKPLCNKILNAMHCTPTFLASLCEGKMSCRVPQ